MTISRDNKTLILKKFKYKLKNFECVLLAHYSGVNVQDLENFRKLSRNSGVEVKVIKNSLFRLALEGSSFTSLSEHSFGPTIYGFGEDPVSSKVFNEFSRKMTVLRLLDCYLTMKLKFTIFHQEKSYCQNWFCSTNQQICFYIECCAYEVIAYFNCYGKKINHGRKCQKTRRNT